MGNLISTCTMDEAVVEKVKVYNSLGNLRATLDRLGIKNLRNFQADAVDAILDGRDCLVIAPTASGKSLCYVAPSLILSGLVLIISPLISLMRDQIRELKEKGISAVGLDSMQSPSEKADILEKVRGGRVNILFISPERLALPSFRSFLRSLPVVLVGIDEAHCVNQWGFDFRPEYIRISGYLDDCYKGPRIALTATARVRDRQQICEVLGLKDPRTIVSAQSRNNLSLKVFRARSQIEHLNFLLQSTLSTLGSGIIYGATRKQCDEIGVSLRNAGVTCGVYHAGIEDSLRNYVYENFMLDRIRVVVATKAFGMGINKKDIRFVFHATLPSSIEAYSQEIGRAGRDGHPSKCYMFYTSRDYHLQKYMIEKSFPAVEKLKEVFRVATETIQENYSLMEPDLRRILEKKLNLQSREVEICLEFLFKERIFKKSDLVKDSWDDQGVESMVSVGELRSLDFLIQEISNRKQEKLQKLSAIYELAKGDKKPEFYIESYFS